MKAIKSKIYVIGVDGGGTRTTAVVADLDGKILKKARGESINYHGVGEKRAGAHLHKLLKNFLKKYWVGAVVIGFAGLDTKKDYEIYQRIVKRVLPSRIKFFICNDTKTALEAACDTKSRLLIISGTGSNVYGEYGEKGTRAGGWDFLLADEGSGFEFGMKAARAAIRSFDGRGPKTILEKLVLKKNGSKAMTDFIPKVYEIWHKKPQTFKQYIASFAPVVDEAYKKRDKIAKQIIEEGAEELFLGARAVIKKLKTQNQPLCVGYVGSNFKAPLLKELLSREIKKLAPKAYFVHDVEPAQGAVKIAINIFKSHKR